MLDMNTPLLGEDGIKPKKNMKLALFLLSLSVLSQSMMVTGSLSVSIGTIERLFRFRSTQVAMIDIIYNFSYAIFSFLIGYFISHKKMKWISLGLILMSLGGLLFILPVIFVDEKSFTIKNDHSLCSNETLKEPGCKNGSILSLLIMCLAYAIIGMGATPLYTLAINFIKENSSDALSGIYNGIYYANSAIGPVISTVIFFYVSEIPLKLVKNKDGLLNSTDKNWISAYWIIYVVSSVLCILIAIPTFFYPEHPNNQDNVKMLNSLNFKKFKSMTLKILSNRPFVFLNIAGIFESCLRGAVSIFIEKYIEAQFSLNSGQAALMGGSAMIIGAILGILFGGWLIKYFQWPTNILIKRLWLISGLEVVLFSFFFIRCPETNIMGVKLEQDKILFTNPIAAQCHCDIRQYFPVCFNETTTFYSPCSIGCQNHEKINGTSFFRNCHNHLEKNPVTVTKGYCNSRCRKISIFLFCCLVGMFLEYSLMVPQIIFTQNILEQETKLCGISIQQVIIRLSLMIGPVYQGYLFDFSCKIFAPLMPCESTSNCLKYNLKYLSYSLAIPAITMKALSTTFLVLTDFSMKRNMETKDIEPMLILE